MLKIFQTPKKLVYVPIELIASIDIETKSVNMYRKFIGQLQEFIRANKTNVIAIVANFDTNQFTKEQAYLLISNIGGLLEAGCYKDDKPTVKVMFSFQMTGNQPVEEGVLETLRLTVEKDANAKLADKYIAAIVAEESCVTKELAEQFKIKAIERSDLG